MQAVLGAFQQQTAAPQRSQPTALLPLPSASSVPSHRSGLDQYSLLLYNNLLALPLMASYLLLATNELAGAAAYPRLLEPGFALFLLLSCSQAFLLNLCIFRCVLRGA